MIRCSYSTYLFADKKRQLSSHFYIFFITTVFILTSCCSINIFAGTTGVDDYDSAQFKRFIKQTFVDKETSACISETDSALLDDRSFQTLSNELVKCGYLDSREGKELNSLITFAQKEKEKAKTSRKKVTQATSTQSQNLENILRLLMKQGVGNGKLPDIISTMFRISPVSAAAITIQGNYAKWFKKAEAQRTTMATPSGTSAQETIDGEETPSSENTITPEILAAAITSALKKTEKQRATQAHCSKTCLLQLAQKQSTPSDSIEALVAPTASLFFENLLEDTSKIDWPSIALAWLSVRKADSEIFKLFRYDSHRERFTYFQSLITREDIKTEVFMKLAAIFHEAGSETESQAKKMLEPATANSLDLSMESLLEYVNEKYPTSSVFKDFHKTGIVDFFEKNKSKFNDTVVLRPNALLEKMNLTTLNIQPVFSDFIDAVRHSKSPAEKIKSYYKLLTLISDMQEKQETDSSLTFLNFTRALTGQSDSQTDSAPSEAYDEHRLRDDIISILGKHGTREQKIGMILMTNGRIYSDPANPPSQAKNYFPVPIQKAPTGERHTPYKEERIVMQCKLDLEDGGLVTLAGNPSLNAVWRSIVLALFALEEPKRSSADIEREIVKIIELNKRQDYNSRPYYYLHHALSAARKRINNEQGVGIKNYPHKFDDKLFKVLNDKGLISTVRDHWVQTKVFVTDSRTFC